MLCLLCCVLHPKAGLVMAAPPEGLLRILCQCGLWTTNLSNIETDTCARIPAMLDTSVLRMVFGPSVNA